MTPHDMQISRNLVKNCDECHSHGYLALAFSLENNVKSCLLTGCILRISVGVGEFRLAVSV